MLNSYKILFGILLSLSTGVSTIRGLTVNGQNVHELLKPGETLCYTPDPKANHISFSFKDENLTIGTLSLPDKDIENIKKNHSILMSKKNQMSGFSGRNVNLGSGKDSLYQGTCLEAQENLTLQAGNSLTITNSLLKANNIFLAGKKLAITGSYVNSKTLQLEASSPDALFQVIHITFSDTPSIPCLLDGTINLENGNIENVFVIFGANKLTIQFHEKIFSAPSEN